jgi:hypothetical protein
VINDSKALSKRQASSNRCAQNHRPWDNRQGGWITEGDALIEPTLGAFEVYVTLRGSKLKIHITAAAPVFSVAPLSRACIGTLLAFSALSFFAAGSATASDTGVNTHQAQLPQQAQNARVHGQQLVEQKTLSLASQMAEYRRLTQGAGAHAANPEALDRLTQGIFAIALARQTEQAALVKVDPAAAVRSILPESARVGMPAEVQAMLAQKRELEGTLDIVYEDFSDPSLNRLRYYLSHESGVVEIHLPAHLDVSHVQSGTKVRAKGWLFQQSSADAAALNEEITAGGDLVLGSAESLVIMAAGSSADSSSSSTSTALPNTKGEQKVLVLMLNFQDNPGLKPWTTAQVQQMVFGKVNDYYREASYNQTWLSGDVKGFYTLPINTSCDYFGLDSYAMQAARDNGIDLSQYQRLVYLFPKNASCGWLGQGTIGGTPSRSWINGELNLTTIGHELGHNLGLQHARELDCGSGYLSSSCVSITYGDKFDIMGNSEGHFNAFNKERLGWFRPEMGEIVTAATAGSYLLEPYETAPNGVAKSLKVRRGTDATSGEPLWYYLEYRQALGFDSFLAGKKLTQGALVHLNLASDLQSSQLLDMAPKSSLNDLDDAALIAGRSYTDADAGVTITTEWADSTGVGVNVSYSTQSCIRSNPTLVLTPNVSAWVTAGTSVSYSATVTNNDSPVCASNSFSVSAQVPAGWSAPSKSLSLAPGVSGSVTLNVTSSISAANGFYDINMTALSGSYQSSGIVSYVVNTPLVCELASPQWTLSNGNGGAVAAGTSVTYQGTLKSLDSGSCSASTFDVTANLSSSWTVSAASVSLVPGESQPVSITVASASTATAGVYDYSLSAHNRSNAVYQTSASASYTVQQNCSLVAPKLVVANPVGLELAAGSAQSYSVTVTNQNSQSCSDASFSVFASVPAGWSATSSNVTLASAASKTVSITAVSATTATAGSYNLTLTARNTANSSYQASTGVVYLVAPKANTAPLAVDDNISMASKTAISINVLANDSDPEADVITVTAVTQGAKGSVQIQSNGSLVYTPGKGFKNGDSFSYTISDGKLSATATVVLSLSGSSGGGGKGKGNR